MKLGKLGWLGRHDGCLIQHSSKYQKILQLLGGEFRIRMSSLARLTEKFSVFLLGRLIYDEHLSLPSYRDLEIAIMTRMGKKPSIIFK